jgi:two-component system, LuxR family, response regulator FixJ
VEFSELISGVSQNGDERGAMNPHSRVIAVIDDDEAVCDSTRFLLETHDFEVSTYLSGSEFLRENPDVACVIVDYQMPSLNGFEFVSQLRMSGSAAPIIIMITATPDPAIERRAAELGISRVLQKPLSNRVLMQAVREELG